MVAFAKDSNLLFFYKQLNSQSLIVQDPNVKNNSHNFIKILTIIFIMKRSIKLLIVFQKIAINNDRNKIIGS